MAACGPKPHTVKDLTWKHLRRNPVDKSSRRPSLAVNRRKGPQEVYFARKCGVIRTSKSFSEVRKLPLHNGNGPDAWQFFKRRTSALLPTQNTCRGTSWNHPGCAPGAAVGGKGGEEFWKNATVVAPPCKQVLLRLPSLTMNDDRAEAISIPRS